MKLNSILLSTLLLTSSAFSSELETQFNYFGSLVASTINKSGYEARYISQTDIDDSVHYSTYSKIGGQISAFKDDFSFYAQAVAYQNEGDNEVELAWLNGKYQFNDNISLKVGRMQHALFLNSNTIDIDYIHKWAKAPVEIYSIMPIRSFDGIEINYENMINDYYIELKLTPYGKAKKDVEMLGSTNSIEYNDIRSIALNVQKDNFTFKATYSTGVYNAPSSYITGLDSMVSGFEQIGNDMSRYSFDHKRLDFLTLGLDYNYGNFSLNTEYLDMDSDSLMVPMQAYYVMMSYRYDKFTPFFIYSENKNDKDFYSVDDINIPSYLATLDSTTYASLLQAKAGLESTLYGINCSQQTKSIGVRYNYDIGIVFKAQVDRITFSDYGTNPYAGFGLDSYVRRGFLSQEVGVANEAVYQFTLGMSFAF